MTLFVILDLQANLSVVDGFLSHIIYRLVENLC